MLAVLGPGLLAGLSDDDPAGITTYSILGAQEGYRLLWVLAISTVALIVFHDLGARMGIVTGRGLAGLVRRRYHPAGAWALVGLLLVANLGTTCAELAGVGAASEMVGISRVPAVALAVVLITTLLLKGSFHRIEHILIAIGGVFVAYVAAAILAHPDWSAAARGLVVPSVPVSRDGLLVVVATIGTTLAPWGLTFIQSYAADKHLLTRQIRAERFDVVLGAVLTGVIGACIVIACAATLRPRGITIQDASQAAQALKPVAGSLTTALFGIGLIGAALLAAAILPLATAYSVCEAADRPAHLGAGQEGKLFRAAIAGTLIVAGVLVCIPGAPLVRILYLTQALNAILLIPVLWVIRRISMDVATMGEFTLSRNDRWLTAMTLVGISAAVVALLVITVS